MPEPQTVSNEPAPRRQARKSPPEEGGGGKVVSITLVVLLLGLGFALFKRHTGANARAQADELKIATLNSNLAELKTRIALDQGNADVARSNFQAALDQRAGELVVASNRLVQARLLLEQSQQDARLAHGEIPAKAVAIAALEAQRDELQCEVARIPGLQREVIELKEKLNQVYLAQANLHDMLGRARLEKAELERQIEDPLFLRAQERRVIEAAEMRRRAANGRRIDSRDRRVRLELQLDGSVRPAYTASAPLK